MEAIPHSYTEKILTVVWNRQYSLIPMCLLNQHVKALFPFFFSFLSTWIWISQKKMLYSLCFGADALNITHFQPCCSPHPWDAIGGGGTSGRLQTGGTTS